MIAFVSFILPFLSHSFPEFLIIAGMEASIITSEGTCKLVIPLSESTIAKLALLANVASISASISSEPERHLSFYNSAGPMSLKFHAFQLLPGIGNAKAIQMVQKRGGSGWNSFEDVDDDCGIESVRLLAERYVKEMEDTAQTPRLLDLLVRIEQ